MPVKSIIVAGPTASGKTALAVRLAQATNGAVINADSIQVYADLQYLSARPTFEEMQGIPHHLFGHVHSDRRYSVGQWLEDVAHIWAEFPERTVIFCGGTGLYLRALQQGLVDTPDIPPDIKATVFALYQELEHAEFVRYCQDRHPLVFAHIKVYDPQRVLRAAEVLWASAKPLIIHWQERQSKPLASDAYVVSLLPERAALYAKIDARCAEMLSLSCDEVKKLLAQNLSHDLPIMRCIGVDECAAFADGKLSLDQALQKFSQRTRHYAKRQHTWLRHQMPSDRVIPTFGSDVAQEDITDIIAAWAA